MPQIIPTFLLAITPKESVSYGFLDVLVAAHLCLAVLIITYWTVRSLRSKPANGMSANRMPVRERDLLVASRSMETRLVETHQQVSDYRRETAECQSHISTLQQAMTMLKSRVEELEIELVARSLHPVAADCEFTDPEAPVVAPELAGEASPKVFLFKQPTVPVSQVVPVSHVDEKLGLVYTERPGKANDLTLIWGVGEVLQSKLHESGIYFYDQIANWTGLNIASFDNLFMFKGRIDREQWVSQAESLRDKTTTKAA